MHCLECKICKDIPNQLVLALCCGQVIGCSACFERCVNTSRSCPLCRATDPQSVAVNGYEGLYSQLRLMSGESDRVSMNMKYSIQPAAKSTIPISPDYKILFYNILLTCQILINDHFHLRLVTA